MSDKPQTTMLQTLRQTQPAAIAELEIVRNKFIQNYNYCHKDKIGELVYHQQVVFFNQIISASDDLKKADPFTIYACFVTAAVNGDSFDPNDEEIYLLALKGKAVLWPQTKSRVKRLRNTGQVQYADQPKLVYEGDIFEVENGRVLRHVEKFTSEKIIAGYIRFVVDSKGNDKFFIYRKSDWEAWKAKSTQKSGDNWAGGKDGQPLASFLRTKIAKHACKDKSWASGRVSPLVEQFPVEVEPDEVTETEEGQATDVTNTAESFSPETTQAAEKTVVHQSEEEEGAF